MASSLPAPSAATAADLLADARRDDKVKALVLRVDSPGGSASPPSRSAPSCWPSSRPASRW
jgi:hypothetical protein